jgi:hypothetical protein
MQTAITGIRDKIAQKEISRQSLVDSAMPIIGIAEFRIGFATINEALPTGDYRLMRGKNSRLGRGGGKSLTDAGAIGRRIPNMSIH